MEGVGARLGRSSTRYGPAVVFTGRVRKWKKRWVHVSPSARDPSGNNKHGGANGGSNHSQMRSINGSFSSNGSSTVSHLLLYKWTPLSQSSNGNGKHDAVSNGGDTAAAEQPPKRRFKFVPIAVLEEQKNEDLEDENDDDEEAKPRSREAELTSKSNSLSENPDINDVPMEESQEDKQSIRQDLNETTLDLSLG